MKASCVALLAIFFALRLGIPFLPSGPWSPSGYQCGSYHLFLKLGQPYTCTADAAFGEGAQHANRLDFLHFRRETFTVDSHGYRNLPAALQAPKVILSGSSFSLGLSLSDDDTLSAQLNRRLGNVVFNTSDVLNPVLSATPLLQAGEVAGIRDGWVLLEILNRAPYGYAPPHPVSRGEAVRQRLALLQSFERRMKNPYALTRITSLINLHLENDQWLPNPERDRFPEEELVDGRHMLFYRDDRQFFLAPSGSQGTAESIVKLRGDLARSGLRLAVMLAPTGYSVYAPLFRAQPGPDTAGPYMEGLAEDLKRAGVPVLNCLPVMRAAAARALAQGRLIYWPDDGHWNPDGVSVAADAVAPWLAELMASHALQQ